MKVLFLEPFFGGSHADFATGLTACSRHDIELVTLPSRFWKWRMRGAALYFLQRVPRIDDYDVVLTTDLMSLADFKALGGPDCPPALVYFHENQLSYPLSPGERMDYQFGFTDITTALTADRVLFNSQSHLAAFFSNLPGFIARMPEFKPHWVTDAIRAKAGVLYPGCRFPLKSDVQDRCADKDRKPPLIIWNHRWEFDKNPADFFAAIDAVIARKIDLRIALLGENFKKVPRPFLTARKRLGDRIVHYGHVASRAAYIDWLRQGAIVVSTATQENFGISVVEAVRYGCIPLLPDRLSYPEILPAAFHADCLYRDLDDLIEKLSMLAAGHPGFAPGRRALSEAMGAYAWESLIDRYDEEIDTLGRLAAKRHKNRKKF